MKEKKYNQIRKQVDLHLTRSLRGQFDKEAIYSMFTESINSLHQILRSQSLSEIVLFGMNQVIKVKFESPTAHVPQKYLDKIYSKPSRLGEWYDQENIGMSLIFEGLRYSKSNIDEIPRMVSTDTLVDLYFHLFQHRWACYMKYLEDLTPQELRILRQRKQYAVKERNRTIGAQIRKERKGTLIYQYLVRASWLEDSILISQKLLDKSYYRAYRCFYSDILKLGSAFFRLGAIEEKENTIIWPRQPIELNDIGPLFESIFEHHQPFKPFSFNVKWISEQMNNAIEQVTLFQDELMKLNQNLTVYEYLQTQNGFPMVGFIDNDRKYVLTTPIYAASILLTYSDGIGHDMNLEQTIKSDRNLRRNRQRWIDARERIDIKNWKIELLDKVGFQWVKVGPFRIQIDKTEREIDILALLLWHKKPILFVGEVKRHRGPFFPYQQIQALSFIQDSYEQAQRSCDFLKESKTPITILEKQTGKSLQGISRFQPFVMTPHIHHIEKGMLVFWSDDEPDIVREKINEILTKTKD